MNAAAAQRRLRSLANPAQAAFHSRYFKTGPGEYAEGDQFLGVKVPETRRVVREFRALPLADVKKLLRSPWHEERLLALLILVSQFEKADDEGRAKIYRLYLANIERINNWDLVDTTAPNIVGAYLHDKPRQPLYELAKSASLWERRIAIIATAAFIRANEFSDTLKIARLLLHDREDLIHKAVGWMLREVGQRDREALETFLQRHYRSMPRTMLRSVIEKFPEPQRLLYLRGRMTP